LLSNIVRWHSYLFEIQFGKEMKLFWRDEIRRKDIDTLKRQLRSKLGGYVKDINHVTTKSRLFRGVICDERPTTIDRISYPPVTLITKLGRLNRERQSVFYASCGAPAIYYEIHAKAGDRVAVSTWELVEPVYMHNLGFHPKTLKQIGGPMNGSRQRFANPIPNETESNRKLRRQLSEAFADDVREGEEWRYKLPIAINELLFDGAEPLPINTPDGPRFNKVVGTVYPAMRMKGAADNVAMWPEFVNCFLRLKFVSYVLVEAADAERQSYSVSSLAQSDEFVGNEIIWRPGITDERLRRGHISYENSQWILRDGLGEIYDVH
jgi:hypothetical protein